MEWNTIDSSVGRLWLMIRVAWFWVLDKLVPGLKKNRPSPLKTFNVTKGN